MPSVRPVELDPPETLSRKSWPPDYDYIWRWRIQTMEKLEKHPELIPGAKIYYAQNPGAFINNWVDTFDPRNAGKSGLPTTLPLNMFERQDEMVQFLWACLKDEENGLVDKSRDMGATWICCGFSVWGWLFLPGFSAGWGSRKEILVDKLGDPDSIFEKLRRIVRGLPSWMLPENFSERDHMTYMRIVNPETGATITGEAGDNIGRGGRKTIYFKDESAHYEHPESIEAALMDNTRVQIDISTPNGVGNVYDVKRQMGVEWTPKTKVPQGTTRIFVLDWSDHPTKDAAWHKTREKTARDNGLLHLFRQEVDRDPTASLSGIIIKPEWVRAAVDAHVKLKFDDSGTYCGGFDPFDEGGDQHAFSLRKGVVLKFCNDWSEGDTGEATREVLTLVVGKTPLAIQYDCVGIGAGVKAESNRLAKEKKLPLGVTFHPWDGGAAVKDPEQYVIPGDRNTPLNKDFYANLKAQGWWALARRFENTYRMINEGVKFPVAQLISIDGKLPKLKQLMRELSQPVMKKTGDLKLIVDKKPEGSRSPNMADSVMMNYFPVQVPMVVNPAAAQALGRMR